MDPRWRGSFLHRAAGERAIASGLALLALTGACRSTSNDPVAPPPPAEPGLPQLRSGLPVESHPEERSLRNVRRLTFEGANAEAYWSPDGRSLVFQSTRGDLQCDQIFLYDLETGETRPLSRLGGKTTCAYFLPDGERILYSSTHLAGTDCPERPPRSRDPKHYVWPIHETYDLFLADLQGNLLGRLTDTPGYDAEATVSPRGDRIVFTSVRDGDVELYSMNLDGSEVRRLTHAVGYDGGAFFSPDGTSIVFRAQVPKDAEEEAQYRDLLSKNLVNPTEVELYLMRADGGDRRRVTENGAANFAPCFFPAGNRILFSSNLGDPERRTFHLFACDLDGENLTQVTFEGTFNCFPHFSPDGRRLVFVSNRFAAQGLRAYDVLVADWVEGERLP